MQTQPESLESTLLSPLPQDILIKQNPPRIQYYEVIFNPKNICCLVHITLKHTYQSEKDARF